MAKAATSDMSELPSEVNPKRLKVNKKSLIIFVVLVLLLVVAGAFAYQWRATDQLKKENVRLSNPQEAAKAEAEKLTGVLGAHIELPSGETPTIATVVDASKLKSQAFFANAQNGDKVFMYSQAKKAILFRPSTNKVIEVAPINIGNDTTPATPTPAPAQKP